MGYSVKINKELTKKYEAVSSSAFKQFLNFAQSLKFKKMQYLDNDSCKETYFDTPNHLLNSSGIILSRFQEGSNVFFKVENTSALSSMLNKMGREVFVHKVGAGDKLYDHAFYIKDGITSIYSTPFSVDLENIIKTAVPKMEVRINASIYEIISGSGMRVKLALENKTVENFETKREYNIQSMTIKLDNNPSVYLQEFNDFNNQIQKWCKEFMYVDENQFDWATNVTKPIVVEKKSKDKKKKVPPKKEG